MILFSILFFPDFLLEAKNRKSVASMGCCDILRKKMIKIAIVEDEESHRLLLQRYVERFASEASIEVQTTLFKDGLSFLAEYDTGFQIVFMDIAMPGMDGLETAKRLRSRDSDAILVFVTSLANYALKGYEVDAMDFLVKPIDYFPFYHRMERAVRLCAKKQKISLFLPTSDGKVRVQLEDVRFVESQLHYLIYHVGKESYRIRGSLKDLPDSLGKLPFVRSSNSFLVNLSYVDRVQGESLTLQGGEVLPISRSRKKEFLEALAVFYGDRK